MTCEKLPKILVITLDNILEEHSISSWHITGGPYYTQLSIRFAHGEIIDNTKDIKYRRTPPSQIRRDKARLNKLQERQEHFTYDTNKTNRSASHTDMPPIISNSNDEKTKDSSVTNTADDNFPMCDGGEPDENGEQYDDTLTTPNEVALTDQGVQYNSMNDGNVTRICILKQMSVKQQGVI